MRASNSHRLPTPICGFLLSGLVVLGACLAALPVSGQVSAAKPLPATDPLKNPSSAAAKPSAYTLGTKEIKIQYRLKRDQQHLSIDQAVPSPKAIEINWERSHGPMPDNPILIQITFTFKFDDNKTPATYSTAVPVVSRDGKWSIDVSDVVNRLIADINATLPSDDDLRKSKFPLDTTATVKVIAILKSDPQYVPQIKKDNATGVNEGDQLKVTPALLLGDTDAAP